MWANVLMYATRRDDSAVRLYGYIVDKLPTTRMIPPKQRLGLSFTIGTATFYILERCRIPIVDGLI